MYCRNCAYRMDDMAVVCVKCGTQRGFGVNCAAPTNPAQAICTNCGVQLTRPIVGEQKSKLAAGLLGILLGFLGVHNFYPGYTSKALAQLLISILSCGVLAFASGIWGLVEGIMILTGSTNTDANGVPLKD